MKLLVVSLIFLIQNLFANNQNLNEYAESMIVKNLITNKTLVSNNQQKKIRPASLTKIMTSIIAIESGLMDYKVNISEDMTNVEPSIIGLKEGDIVLLSDLVKSALIASSNDATKSISIYLGKGHNSLEKEQNFIKYMNLKAKIIGMKNTTFTNASGFDFGEHYTTAEDLLKLSEYAIKNKTFNEIVKLKTYAFSSINSNKKFYAKTHNKLMLSNKDVIGLKTGYTKKAGPCLIARAKKDNKDILLIIINSKVNRWDISNSIFKQLLI